MILDKNKNKNCMLTKKRRKNKKDMEGEHNQEKMFHGLSSSPCVA